MNSNGCQFGQHMVNQGPKYDNGIRRRRRRRERRRNQVMSRTGIIRPDKRIKAKFV